MNKSEFIRLMSELKYWALVQFVMGFVDTDETQEELLTRIWEQYVLDNKEILWYNPRSMMVSSYAENGSEQINHVYFFEWVRMYNEKYKRVGQEIDPITSIPVAE